MQNETRDTARDERDRAYRAAILQILRDQAQRLRLTVLPYVQPDGSITDPGYVLLRDIAHLHCQRIPTVREVLGV